MATNAGPTIDRRNIIAYYDAGNRQSYPGSGSSWFDLSGNGLHVTLFNSPTFSTDGGGSLVFNGSNQYGKCPANSLFAIGTGPFTIHIWYKHTQRNGYGCFFDFGSGSNSGQGILLFGAAASSFPYGLLHASNGFRILDYNLRINTWEMVTLVGNGAGSGSRNMTMYRNGRRTGNIYTVDYNWTANEPWIGWNKAAGGGETMKGSLSTIAYYSRAFDQREILEFYNETKSRFDDIFEQPQTYYPRPVTANLALLLDGASYSGSGTNWPDTSGNGRDGTLINSPTYNSANGGYFTFNGPTSSAYANTAYVLPASNSFTMAGFVRSAGSAGSFSNRVFGNADSTGGGSGASVIFLDSGNDRTLFFVRRGNGGTDLSYIPDLELTNTWHYICMVYDTSTGLRMHIDGNQITSSATLGYGSSLTFRVGRDGNGSDAFKGDVGLVHIYNKALSNSEIQQNFNAYRGRYGI